MGLISLATDSAKPLRADDAGNPKPPEPVGNALQRLVEFIPIESITLFWVAVPAAESIYRYCKTIPTEQPIQRPTEWDWWLYGIMVAATPLLLLLVYLSTKAANGEPFPPLKKWPWWRAVASGIAFAAWALAVPGNPYFAERFPLIAIWVGALVVSMLLGLLDPIVLKWIFPGQDKPK